MLRAQSPSRPCDIVAQETSLHPNVTQALQLNSTISNTKNPLPDAAVLGEEHAVSEVSDTPTPAYMQLTQASARLYSDRLQHREELQQREEAERIRKANPPRRFDYSIDRKWDSRSPARLSPSQSSVARVRVSDPSPPPVLTSYTSSYAASPVSASPRTAPARTTRPRVSTAAAASRSRPAARSPSRALLAAGSASLSRTLPEQPLKLPVSHPPTAPELAPALGDDGTAAAATADPASPTAEPHPDADADADADADSPARSSAAPPRAVPRYMQHNQSSELRAAVGRATKQYIASHCSAYRSGHSCRHCRVHGHTPSHMQPADKRKPAETASASTPASSTSPALVAAPSRPAKTLLDRSRAIRYHPRPPSPTQAIHGFYLLPSVRDLQHQGWALFGEPERDEEDDEVHEDPFVVQGNGPWPARPRTMGESMFAGYTKRLKYLFPTKQDRAKAKR